MKRGESLIPKKGTRCSHYDKILKEKETNRPAQSTQTCHTFLLTVSIHTMVISSASLRSCVVCRLAAELSWVCASAPSVLIRRTICCICQRLQLLRISLHMGHRGLQQNSIFKTLLMSMVAKLSCSVLYDSTNREMWVLQRQSPSSAESLTTILQHVLRPWLDVVFHFFGFHVLVDAGVDATSRKET